MATLEGKQKRHENDASSDDDDADDDVTTTTTFEMSPPTLENDVEHSEVGGIGHVSGENYFYYFDLTYSVKNLFKKWGVGTVVTVYKSCERMQSHKFAVGPTVHRGTNFQ